MNRPDRLLGLMVGDMKRQPDMWVKYGMLFDALARQFDLKDIVDVSLKGPDYWLNLAYSFKVDMHEWKESSVKNVRAYQRRSKTASIKVAQWAGQVDYVLQLSGLFEAHTDGRTLIYTDYTSALSAICPESGRSPFNSHQLAAWKHLEKQAYQNARHIFVRASRVKQSMMNDYGITESKISVIGGGLNFEIPEERSQPRSSAAPVILFVGRRFHRKGGDLMLQAFARVRQQIPQARLLMMTAGPVPAHLPVEGVEIIAPSWQRDAVARLYSQADVFVLPSRLETWGDVLLEAMAHELPCVGVWGQSMEEMIEDGVTGRMANPSDPESLSQAILQVLSEPNWGADLGKAGRQRAIKEFTWDHIVDRMKIILSTL